MQCIEMSKVTAAATCVIIQYSGSSWNQAIKSSIGQYFAYIIGQFRDFDPLGNWDPQFPDYTWK